MNVQEKTDLQTIEQYASDPIEVPKTLSQDEVQAFVDNGYHVAKGLITPDELEELKADAIKLERGGYPCETLQPLDESLTDAEALQRILCIHQPHFVSDICLKYVKHPKIAGILSQVVGAHLPFWDGSVKCMQSMFFVKPPTFQGQAWHQDEIYIPTRDRTLCGAWIAIDDASIENGCLWVVPGSHKNGYLFPQRPHNKPEEFDFAPESFGFDEAQEVPVEVPAGSVVFFNGHLLHRSRKNNSEIYRRVLVNHYMNAWSMLPWTVGEGQSPANADDRRVVSVAGIDPYAWKGTLTPENNVYLRSCKVTEEMGPT